jgi:uncharacterized protein YbaA (DUF1428 family)
VQGDLADVTCLLGTMVQETFDSHPAIAAACRDGIESHARTLVPTIEAAKQRYAPAAAWDAENLALYTQSSLQGAFILAKANGNANAAVALINHLRTYIKTLLTPSAQASVSSEKFSNYVDGYVLAVPAANKDTFIFQIQQNAQIYKEYGALRVVECWGDDVPTGRINSYGHAVQQEEGEVVVFNWIEWPSKALRDSAWPRIFRDRRMQSQKHPQTYDATRMLRGGFQTLVNV